MRVLLTGGSGDLGTVLALDLFARGDTPVTLDLRPPQAAMTGAYIAGSITDRSILKEAVQGVDVIVHIAAWHGVHEFRGEKDAYDFWDVNVTGTFNVFEAAQRAGVRNVVYISTTSIDEPTGLYGHSKILGEDIARTYHERHAMNVITLRPRAFIPSWNTAVYANYLEWIPWFWGGAVHLMDVKQAVLLAIKRLMAQPSQAYHALVVDGAYEYTFEDLANWQRADSFRRYYAAYEDLALRYSLPIDRKPDRYDLSETTALLGYQPTFSLMHVLKDLEAYGVAGPPRPF